MTPVTSPSIGQHLSRRALGVPSSVIRDLLLMTERADVLSLAGGMPAAETFPTADLARVAVKVLAEPSSFQYSSTEGQVGLREWLLARSGLRSEVGQVIMTHGSQQGLDLVTRALCDPGDKVAADSPGYLGALQVFQANECSIVPVTVDADGLDPDHLETLLVGGLRPKLVYTCPTFQNPGGATMPEHRRRALAALGDRYGFVIVEDDPYSALRWAGNPQPPIAAFTDRAVLLSTFSKTLSPGLRLGSAIAPPWLATAMVRLKQSADLHTGTLTQRLATALVTEPGWYDAHVATLAPLYAQRARALTVALRSELGDAISFTDPSGGMFLWAEVPGVDSQALLPHALEAGVAFVPGTAFHTDGGGRTRMRLSFSSLGTAELTEAARRLAEAIHQPRLA